MNWSDERVEQLMELAARGLSARQIANKLGGVTRSAVIGAMYRRGIKLKTPPCVPKPPLTRAIRNGGAALAAIKARQKQERELRDTVGDNKLKSIIIARATSRGELPVCEAMDLAQTTFKCEPVALLDLKKKDCRWPIDGPDGTAAQRRFCGCERAHERTPYCDRHHATCYVGLPIKRLDGRRFRDIRVI